MSDNSEVAAAMNLADLLFGIETGPKPVESGVETCVTPSCSTKREIKSMNNPDTIAALRSRKEPVFTSRGCCA
jgi:hypothetical protein